jgi:hypothetical protein
MTLGEVLFVLALGAAAGYAVNNYGLDRKAIAALNGSLDNWTRRSAQIMLQEIDFTFPSDAKLDSLAST